MSWIAAAVLGGSVVSGLLGANASSSAAGQQAGAANNATAMQQGMFNTIQGNMAPYMQQGQQSLSQLGGYMNASTSGGAGGQPGLLHSFNASDLNANLAPNYQFQLGQGMGMLSNQNAATGGAGGGNAFTGEQAYVQNTAQNAYQNAYNNYNNNQQNIYSRLGNLASLGQASGTNSALGGSAFAGGMSNSIIGAGIIGQPYALRQAGLLTGVILLIVLTITVDWTIRLIVINSKLSGRDSFQGTVEHCFGKVGLVAISVAQWAFAFGGMVAFGVIVGDSIPHVLEAVWPGLGEIPILGLITNRRVVILVFIMGISWPLSLYRDIAKVFKSKQNKNRRLALAF